MIKLVKLSVELVIDDERTLGEYLDLNSKESIADYLTSMINCDPEFFGEFDESNIEYIKDYE